MDKYTARKIELIEMEQDRIDGIFERLAKRNWDFDVKNHKYLDHLAKKFDRLNDRKVVLLNA